MILICPVFPYGCGKMRPATAIVCCLVFALCHSSVCGEITNPPVNVAVFEGSSNTMLNCTSKESVVNWLIMPFAANEFNDLRVTVDGQVKPDYNKKFLVYQPRGTYDHKLIILNATTSNSSRPGSFSTAGAYSCQDQKSFAAAQLVVVKSDPICSSATSVKGSATSTALTCTFVYASLRSAYQINAILTWTVNGQPVASPAPTFTVNVAGPNNVATSTITVSSVSNGSPSTYKCVASFGPPAKLNVKETWIAKNAPDYSKSCTKSLA